MKRKIAVTGIIITAILILIYISLRAGMIEKEYLAILSSRNGKITVNLSAYEKLKPLKDKNLAVFLDTATKKFPDIAVLAVSDLNGRLLISGKNDRFINNEQFNDILRAFGAGEFKVHPKSPYLIRYFNQIKYYLFVKEMNEGRMLVMFPYSLRGKLLTKLLLELFLLLILSIIFTTAVYLYLRRSGRAGSADDFVESPPAERAPVVEPRRPASGKPSSAPEELNPEVTQVFSLISEEYNAGEIALYLLLADSGDLVKTHELKGKTFLRIDTPGFDRLDIGEEVMDELSRGSTLVMDRGREIIIPLPHGGWLPAALRLKRESSFSGREIRDITRHAAELAGPVRRSLRID